MIKDTRIDLTEDNKFGRERRIAHEIFGEIVMPWNIRSVNSDYESSQRIARLYGDTLSDDMGCVVRRCSDNKWFFGDPTVMDQPWSKAAFEEELMELNIKDKVFVPCYHCGREHIMPTPYLECLDCKIEDHAKELEIKLFKQHRNIDDGYIPWLDHNVTTYFEDGIWKERIVEAIHVVQELYK